jgi:hypothetical protein
VLGPLASNGLSISNESGGKVCVVARRDMWSRSARRRARATRGTGMEEEATLEPVLLVAYVRIEERTSGGELVVEWKRGQDVQAFESFTSHLGRKMIM